MDFVLGALIGSATITVAVMLSLARSAKEIDEAETNILSSDQNSTQGEGNDKKV